jgi:hypothetical protein
MTLGGSGLNATVGADLVANPSGVALSLTNVGFGLALMGSTTTPSRRWTSLQATAGAVSLSGVTDVTLSSSNLAFNLNRAEAAGDAVVDYSTTSLSVATGVSTSQTLTMAGSRGTLLQASGTVSVAFGTAVQVSGTLGFTNAAGVLEVAGSGVSATLSGGGVTASVTNASFGLEVLANGTYWLDATGGFSLSGGDFASASATSATLQLNTTTVQQTTKTLSFDSFSHVMPTLSAVASPVVSVVGLQASVAGTFSISGNFSFQRSAADEIMVLASSASAWMTAGDFKAGVASAQVALVVKTGAHAGTLLEASGSVNASLGSLLSVSAAQ